MSLGEEEGAAKQVSSIVLGTLVTDLAKDGIDAFPHFPFLANNARNYSCKRVSIPTITLTTSRDSWKQNCLPKKRSIPRSSGSAFLKKIMRMRRMSLLLLS